MRSQGGFSLLEMLLTTSILVIMMMMIFQIFEDYAETTLARATSQFVNEISASIETIIIQPDAFQDIYSYLEADPNNIIELSLNDLTQGFNITGAMVHKATTLNTEIKNRTSLGNGVYIMIHIGDDVAIDTDMQSLEIIITTDDVAEETRVRKSARLMGAHGGFYLDDEDSIKSAYAVWTLNSNIFDSTHWGAKISSSPPGTNEGAYLVHYKHVNFENIAGDYVYRDKIEGRPELNQINTTLNMAGNNILGADNVEVSNDLTLDASAFINGQARVGGESTFNRSNVTSGRKMTAGNATINGATSGYTGNFSVQGELQSQNTNVDGEMIANAVRFENDTTIQGDLRSNTTSFQDLTIGQTATVSEIASSDGGTYNINANGGQISAIQLNTNGSLNVRDGGLGAINLSASGNTTLNSVRANQVYFEDLSLQGTFGACDKGC